MKRIVLLCLLLAVLTGCKTAVGISEAIAWHKETKDYKESHSQP